MSEPSSKNPAPKVSVRPRRRPPETSEVAPNNECEPAPKPDYEVGYGRPPKKHQFKKNESGNLRGRPKGAKGFKPQLRKALQASMPAKINGRTVHLSRSEIICLALVDKAARGDIRAIKLLIDLDPIAHEVLMKSVSTAVDAALDDEDEAMVAAYLKATVAAAANDPKP